MLKEIDSLINLGRRRQNVVTISVTHSSIASCATLFCNLLPRLSLHCIPLLRLVTLPPRILVVKNSVGRDGWQNILIVGVGSLVGNFEQELTVLSGFKVEFCWWRMLHYFYRQNIEHSSTKLSTVITCHVPSRSKMSGSFSWISAFGGNLFSSWCGILDLRSISVTWPISQVDFFTGLQNDLQFCWLSPQL